MDRYLGSKCPYCEKEFQPGDDVVVCPDCGTPYHRACWKEHCVCAYRDRHGSFEWKPELPLQAVAAQNIGNAYCPNCGAPVAPDARFCPSCGTTFGGADPAGRAPFPGGSYAGEAGAPGGIPFSPDVRVFGDEEPIGDSKAKDYAAFVGKNQRYFLPRFMLFSDGRHPSFNFAAFLFTYLYLFYRKMYGLGIAVFALILLLEAPSLIGYYADIQQAFLEAGVLSGAIFTMPDTQLLSTLSMIGSVLVWGIRLGLLVVTDRYYFHFCTRKIHSLRETYPDNGLYEAGLVRRGGTSMLAVALTIAAVIVAYYLPSYVISISPLFDVDKFAELLSSAYSTV